MMIDLSNFYLKTAMSQQEYMCLKLTNIPDEVIHRYKLKDIATEDGYVYCKIRKGMYGIPQSGIIAQLLLEELLAKVRYTQSKIIPGLWKDANQPKYYMPLQYNTLEKKMSITY
jgi:hypothetical protein